MRFSCLVVAVLLSEISHGFIASNQQSPAVAFTRSHSTTFAASSSSDGEGEGVPQQSRIEGNTREPSKEELAIMDEMITKLSNAKAYDLPNAVRRAFRVISSPRFFMRIAVLADEATDEIEKEKLSALATNLVSTIDAIVSTTEDRLDDTARDVEEVVKAAAEPDSGEFLVPLSTERLGAMRNAIQDLDPISLDEGFLSTVDAWMNKSHQDGMDGMVVILQKVLQMYAGTQVTRVRAQLESTNKSTPASALFDKLLNVDTDAWDEEISKRLQEDVTPAALLGEVQRAIEQQVLGLESGSMAQRVQAEYLREMVTRIEAFEKA